MGHFTVFQSHGLSGWLVPKVMKSCLHFSKLWPKYCRYFFSRHCVVSGSVWGCIHISASEHDTHSIVCFSTANELFILFVWTCVCVCVESWLSQCNKYSYHWRKNVFNVFIFFQLLYYKKTFKFLTRNNTIRSEQCFSSVQLVSQWLKAITHSAVKFKGNYSAHRIIWRWYTGRWWWAVTFGTARRGLGRAAAHAVPSSLYQM